MIYNVIVGLIVVGFAFRFLAEFPVTVPASRITWGAWLLAVILWAFA